MWSKTKGNNTSAVQWAHQQSGQREILKACNSPFTHGIALAGIAGMLVLTPASLFASGFALIEQSVSSMGTAYANGSSGIDDASTIFFNPAGMTRLPGRQGTAAVHIVNSNVDFDGSGKLNTGNPLIAGCIPSPGCGLTDDTFAQGDTDQDLGLTKAIPNLYYSHQYNDKLWFGFGVNAPFGLETDYDGDWVGRYNADKSELITINLNPSLGYRINNKTSVGAGISLMYADAELTNAVDFALSDLLGLIPGGPYFGGAPAGTIDGKAKVTGDDWGFGFNVGLLLEPTAQTRIGLHYRSSVDLDLEGDLKIKGPSPAFNAKDDASAEVTLPDTLSFSIYHAINQQWAIMGDVTWTHWSELSDITIDFDTRPSSITPLDWDNSLRYAIGTRYKHNNVWSYSVGVALDKTPIPSDELRTARIPGEDRTWLAIGANYRHSKQLSLDFGYAHLFVDDPEINSPDAHSPPLTTGFHVLTGDYDASVDILSAQVNWNF